MKHGTNGDVYSGVYHVKSKRNKRMNQEGIRINWPRNLIENCPSKCVRFCFFVKLALKIAAGNSSNQVKMYMKRINGLFQSNQKLLIWKNKLTKWDSKQNDDENDQTCDLHIFEKLTKKIKIK